MDKADRKYLPIVIINNIFDLIRIKLGIRKTSGRFFMGNAKQKESMYRDCFTNETKACLVCNASNYRYAAGMREEILKDFTFTREMPLTVQNTLSLINNANSVSVHIRRGDCVGTQYQPEMVYYKNAIRYLESVEKELSYFIFSDDVEWCKNNLTFINPRHIVDNSEYVKADYYDLFLTSKCKHNIVPNSTFGWWGVWLNQNPNKIVVAPDKWHSIVQWTDVGNTADDMYPSEWITVARDA
jgi:hypothetical protein